MRRAARAAALAACGLLGRASGGRAGHAVVMYHGVGGPTGVDERVFDRQIAYLAERFDVVPLHTLRARVEMDDGRRPAAAVTFDDGRLDHYEVAAPLLERHGVRATFFVVTGLLGAAGHLAAEHVVDLARRGHEVGGHTVTHATLTRVAAGRVRDEVAGSRAALERLLGAPVVSFAYPKGAYDATVREIVRAAGFAQAVTVREAHLPGDTGSLDWLALPRVAVAPGAGMTTFRAKLGPGLALYERLRGR